MGLDGTSFTVSESYGSVELCVSVFSPRIACPVKFPFTVFLTVSNRSTGNIKIIMLFTQEYRVST